MESKELELKESFDFLRGLKFIGGFNKGKLNENSMAILKEKVTQEMIMADKVLEDMPLGTDDFCAELRKLAEINDRLNNSIFKEE